MIRSLLFAFALSLLAAAPAAAQAPIDLGPGRGPSLVVDGAGTTHIVFRSNPIPNSTTNGLTYCRLPRTAATCDVRTFMPLPSEPTSARLYLRADGALIAVAADAASGTGAVRGTLYLSSSVDGGVTFTPPAAIASGQGGAPPVGLSSDGQAVITMRADQGGQYLWRSPFAAPDPRVLLVDDRVAPAARNPELTVLSDGRMLIANESSRGIAWRVFSGGDPLDINAWPARGELRGQDIPVLATGPRGVFLLDDRSGPEEIVDRVAPFGIRSFDTRRLRWRAPRSAGADALGRDAPAVPGNPSSDLTQDARGRLHLLSAARDSRNGTCIQYARTGPRRSQWFGRTTTLFRTTDPKLTPVSPKVAAGADGRGIAAWHSAHGTLAAEGNVYVLRLRQAEGRYRPIADPSKRPACGRRR